MIREITIACCLISIIALAAEASLVDKARQAQIAYKKRVAEEERLEQLNLISKYEKQLLSGQAVNDIIGNEEAKVVAKYFIEEGFIVQVIVPESSSLSLINIFIPENNID